MNGREYLLFTRKERTGILVLVAIILLVAVAPKLFLQKRTTPADTDYRQISGQLSGESSLSVTSPPVEKVTGVDRHAETTGSGRKITRTDPAGKRQYMARRTIEINSADTSAFIALPGIGSKLAARIVLFREKLGGFVRVDQIKEVYGLKDSVVQIILPMLKCDTSLMKKIRINTATEEELKAHPYIRWKLAKAIVSYRDQHGQFTSSADLGNIHSVDSVSLSRLLPYIGW